jgi:potassium efflux system protein
MAGLLPGQETGRGESIPSGKRPVAGDRLTAAQVEDRLAKVEADSGLTEAAKSALQEQYRTALDLLELAEEHERRTKLYTEALESGAERARTLVKNRESLPSLEEAATVRPNLTTGELDQERESQRSEVRALRSEFEIAEANLASVRGRPVQIGVRLPAARGELIEAERSLSAQDPGPAAAVAEAKVRALTTEVAMLLQERESQPERVVSLQAQRDLLASEVTNAEARLEALESRLRRERLSGMDRVFQQVEALRGQAAGQSAGVEARIEELEGLATEFRRLTQSLGQTEDDLGKISSRREELQGYHDRLREQIELVGLEGSLSQVVMEKRRRLPNPRHLDWSIKERESKMREVRLEASRIDQLRDGHAALERTAGSGLERQVLALRGELLDSLARSHDRLVGDLAQLDAEERSYQDLIVEVRSYLDQELFWRRSSPPIWRQRLSDLPRDLRWVGGLERWKEGWNVLRSAMARQPAVFLLAALLVVGSLLTRRLVIHQLEATGKRIRRVRSDRNIYTWEALGWTVLLAAPIPLSLGLLSWAVNQEPGGTDWVRGVAMGLKWSGLVLGPALFLVECARKGGLGTAHFGWDDQGACQLRKGIVQLLFCMLPALLLMSATTYEESGRYFDSIGRFAFILGQLGIALILRRDLGRSPFAFSLSGEPPGGLVARLRPLWAFLVVCSPLALILLSALGWVATAWSLNLVFLGTLALVGFGAVVYGMVLRLFLINERRLALAVALEERRARQEADSAEPELTEDEEIPVEDDEADLAEVGLQTRRLLRSLTAIGLLLAGYLLWVRMLPIAGGLARASLFGVQLFAVGQGVLVLIMLVTVVRNLPGLLELAGFRKWVPDAGTRHAYQTIVQYAVVVVGLTILSRILGLDWVQFGWIAASLSVGLGFGLQEIVANFVCGIILLFERPIRVGDIVTIDQVDGRVSRIQMRATTITNWDRKELVVPNKQFITGTLMNWTLSSETIRIVIPVGVAYGSDIRRAREILLKVADEHPLVLDDPAPAAIFHQFGDSTLDLNLRCFLPSMENRSATITDLHLAIDDCFKEAGIEIAFPQLDLHLRRSGEGVDAGLGQKED